MNKNSYKEVKKLNLDPQELKYLRNLGGID